MQALDVLEILTAYSGPFGKRRPCFDRAANVRNNESGFTDTEPVGHRQKVLSGNPLKLPVDGHQMLVGPFALRIVGKRKIISGSSVVLFGE